jgi:hypothetical protein
MYVISKYTNRLIVYREMVKASKNDDFIIRCDGTCHAIIFYVIAVIFDDFGPCFHKSLDSVTIKCFRLGLKPFLHLLFL